MLTYQSRAARSGRTPPNYYNIILVAASWLRYFRDMT